MARAQWSALAEKRLVSVLRTRILATERTLEQKISDAGPNDQRIEPFVLTGVRRYLIKTGRIVILKRGNTPWYRLAETPEDKAQERLAALEPIYLRTQDGVFKERVGQALEIAVLRALKESGRAYLGTYSDLDEHADDETYDKVEPPVVISGRKMERGPLDYIVFEPFGIGGIEVKNYRSWLYPHSAQVKEMLWKCGDVGAVPVLIARRIPFITFRLLNLGGCLVHQTYNQRYPAADSELAALVRDKDLLGYHDVRIGNEPDARLKRFMIELLPDLVNGARGTFEKFRRVHAAYGKGEMPYATWVREIMVGRGVWAEHEAEESGGRSDYNDPP